MIIRHNGIIVDNLLEAAQFYRQFGFDWTNPFNKFVIVNGKAEKISLIKMKALDHSGMIELLHAPKLKNHIALTVPKQIWNKFKDRESICTNVTDNSAMKYIEDPWNNYIELVREK